MQETFATCKELGAQSLDAYYCCISDESSLLQIWIHWRNRLKMLENKLEKLENKLEKLESMEDWLENTLDQWANTMDFLLNRLDLCNCSY